MRVILEHIKILAPAVLFFWGLLVVSVWRKPQKFRNSLFLMAALFVTVVFLAGMFGDGMGYALLAVFLLTLLALFLVPVMLIINGVQMVRKEGRSFGHMLSLLLGMVVGIGELAVMFLMFGAESPDSWVKYYKITFFIGSTVFYFSCLILAFVLYVLFIQMLPHRMDFNYVIIHGCGLIGGKKVSRLLADRLDKAIEIYEKCEEKPILIPSGGKGADEEVSEAEAMKVYLLEHNIPEEAIIMEDQSATTLENLKNSKQIIEMREGKKKTALVSSNYHVYRCLIYASMLDMKCTGIGARVSRYFWPSATIREFVAVFSKKSYLIHIIIGYVIFVLLPSIVVCMTSMH